MATNFQLKPFAFNLSDINFMLDQIKFKPLFDATGDAIVNWNGITLIYNDKHVQYDTTDMTAAQAIAAYGTSYDNLSDAAGLRDVTGLNNNLLLVNSMWGSVNQPFLQRMQANFDNYVQAKAATDPDAFYGAKAGITAGNSDYTKTASHAGMSVVDYTPRMISQLTTTAGVTFNTTNGHINHDANGFAMVDNYGQLAALGQQDKQNLDNHEFLLAQSTLA